LTLSTQPKPSRWKVGCLVWLGQLAELPVHRPAGTGFFAHIINSQYILHYGTLLSHGPPSRYLHRPAGIMIRGRDPPDPRKLWPDACLVDIRMPGQDDLGPER
jgi:hypothetical protein